MKKIISIGVLFLSTVCAAGQVPPIKGHVLGETMQQFLTVSSVMRRLVAHCRTNPNELLTDPHASVENGDVPPSCQDLLNAVDGKGTIAFTEDFADVYMAPHFFEFCGEVEFSDGRLDMLNICLTDPWSDVYSSLIKKFGNPTSTDTIEMQNGYGAIFYYPEATWEKPGYQVKASEKPLGMMRYVMVELTTTARLKQMDADKPNSLD
jgi:hypothetical protein